MNHTNILLLFSVLFFTLFLSVGTTTAFSQKPVTMIYHRRLIFLKMVINERDETLFLLDTGASASAIDIKTAEKLGLPISGTDKVEGTVGTIEVKKAEIKNLSIGEAKVSGLTVSAYDLSGVLIPEGAAKVDGIVGYDFLRHFSIRIDFINHKIQFSSKPSTSVKKDSNAVFSVSFLLDNGIPRINAILDNKIKTDFRLDTGASLFETSDLYLNITDNNWKALTALDSKLVPETYFTGSGIGGTVKLPVSRIKNLSIGKLSFSSPYVIAQPKAGYFAREDAVGFISNNFLEKFGVVTIDYILKELQLTICLYEIK